MSTATNKKWIQDPGVVAFLLGMAVSGIYYLIVHQPFMKDSVLHAYTTHHVTEYAIVILFCWANAEHFLAYRNTVRERAVLGRKWLPNRAGMLEPECAGPLLQELAKSHGPASGTMMFQRLQSGLRFIHERRSADGFREYLEALAARDVETVYERYGLSRFVTAILPIVGLIGTVVHFGTALGGLSMEGLGTKLPAMLSGLGTAFNTTFIAMSAMAVTMLVRHLIERSENRVVHVIDTFVEDELFYRFKSVDSAIIPFIETVRESQSATLKALALYEQSLAEEWTNRMNKAQNQWEQFDKRFEEKLVCFLTSVCEQQAGNTAAVRDAHTDLVHAQKTISEIVLSINASGELLKLQERLVENLSALRQSQQLESVMHELTAAIHLLTARQSLTLRKAG